MCIPTPRKMLSNSRKCPKTPSKTGEIQNCQESTPTQSGDHECVWCSRSGRWCWGLNCEVITREAKLSTVAPSCLLSDTSAQVLGLSEVTEEPLPNLGVSALSSISGTIESYQVLSLAILLADSLPVDIDGDTSLADLLREEFWHAAFWVGAYKANQLADLASPKAGLVRCYQKSVFSIINLTWTMTVLTTVGVVDWAG
jgi:hypothetical protein